MWVQNWRPDFPPKAPQIAPNQGENLPNCPPKMPPDAWKQPNCPPPNRGKSTKIAKLPPKCTNLNTHSKIGVKHWSKTPQNYPKTRTPPENLNFAVFWVLVPFEIGPNHTKLPPTFVRKLSPKTGQFLWRLGGVGGAKNQTHTTLPQSYPKTTQNYPKYICWGFGRTFCRGSLGELWDESGFFLCLWWVMGRMGETKAVGR